MKFAKRFESSESEYDASLMQIDLRKIPLFFGGSTIQSNGRWVGRYFPLGIGPFVWSPGCPSQGICKRATRQRIVHLRNNEDNGEKKVIFK